MAYLSVQFKPNTSDDWVREKLTEIGLKDFEKDEEREADFLANLQFILLADRSDCGFEAIVRVPDEDERGFSNAIMLISPQITCIERYRGFLG